MTRYLEISDQLADQVRSRRLRPGAELPPVRVHAAAVGATPSTISRAYRHLADAGVLALEPRRRARVAPDGFLAAMRLLHGERVFRLAGSDDPALQIVLGHAGRAVSLSGASGSFQGLRALARADADGAAIHLRHRSGVYNAPFARALLRGREPHLIRLWAREQGLVIPPGNPKRIEAPSDLAALRVAKREPGAGTRVLLDQLLTEAGLDPDQVGGPTFGSHLEIALAVAAGIAHAGLAVRGAAADLDLGFIPLAWERFDIVLPGDAMAAAEPLISALRHGPVRAAIEALGGYDLAGAGQVDVLE